jgi:iron-sulfur cluster assembly accessory protein
MQTSTAYQPYPLNNQPPPPRNTRIPDTSIAGGVPQVNDTRPPQAANRFEFGETKAIDEGSNLSLPELEAQKSQPVPAKQPAAKPRRYKFKPTKAAMKLTPTAVEQLRAMQDQPDAKLIKVGVRNRGCSGLAYHLEYVEKPGPFDETVEQDGVKVLIDSKALFSIVGSEMDWVEDKLNQRFTFTNPNISKLHQMTVGDLPLTQLQRNNAAAANHLWYNSIFISLSPIFAASHKHIGTSGGVWRLDTTLKKRAVHQWKTILFDCLSKTVYFASCP